MAYKDLTKKRAAELRWYYRNKEKVRKYKTEARTLRLRYIQRLKKLPCKDCGLEFPSFVMDFDHKNGTSKVGNINTLASARYGWKILKEEIAKCDVVCVNCHRERTHQRSMLKI